MEYKVITVSASLVEKAITERLNEKIEHGWKIHSMTSNKEYIYFLLKKE